MKNHRDVSVLTGRRGVIRLLGAGLGLGVLTAWRGRAVAQSIDMRTFGLPQGPRDGGALLARARELRDAAVRARDQPYGALVAREGIIIGEAPSLVVNNQDPTAHAEMEAIRDACRRQTARALPGTVLVSTARPCPMCEAAAHWAGIPLIVYPGSDGHPPRLCA